MNMLLDLDREKSETVDLSEQIAYWQKQLVGDWPTLTFLMKDLPQDALVDFATASLAIDDETLSALDSFTEEHGLTHFAVLLATYFILLARYAVIEEIVVGVPLFEMDTAVNILPIRADLTDNPTFLSFAQKVNQLMVDGMNNCDVPVADLLEPFGDVSLQVQFSMEQTADFGGLALTFTEENGRLQGAFRYATELFTSTKISQLTTHFHQLLVNGLDMPETAVQHIPMLTEEERHQILVEWNDRIIPDYQPSSFIPLFEEAAQNNLDGLAVISDFGQLTYRELNQRANQLARHLRSRGAGSGQIVGISMERVPEMLVAMLGVLKSGAAYIPIDPKYPMDRQEFMLEDGNVLAVLTQAHLVAQIPSEKAEIICIDRDWAVIAQQENTNLELDISPEDIAYIIYTSGSTGKPKGVLIPHKAMANFIGQTRQYLKLSVEDISLQFSSISFDASIEEIYAPLTSGATLALRNEAMLEIDAFLDKVNEWHLTALAFPTAFWHELALGLSTRHEKLPESVRQIIFGGEKIMPERIAAWQETHGNYPRIINGYGPTEFTVGGTFSEVNDYEWKDGVLQTHIGRPLANQQAYILSNYLEPIPVGVPGELYLGGIQVAKGYLNRPDLTAERFLENPFYDGPEARLYKTGDLVAYLPDGNIEFIGRADYQVKFRGYRIELGEIEAALNAHTAVQQSVVLIHTNQSNVQRLVAYCVTDEDTDAAELSEFLSQSLPEYMVPTSYTFLDEFPLTPGGKINRRDLPEPVFELVDSAENYIAPRTDLEAELADIWADILGVERVGIQDNFFELGGHSLIAVRMLARAKKATGQTTTLDVFFENPTIKALIASFVGEAARTPDVLTTLEEAINLETIPQIERNQTSYAPSFSQEGIWLHNEMNADSGLYNVPLEMALTGTLDVALFEEAFAQLIQRHESLRTIFVTVDGEVQQHLLDAVIPPFEFIDISDMAGGELDARLLALKNEFWKRPFDLAQGPPVAALLVQTGSDEYRCFISAHHSIADGWSVPIIMHEIGELYTALQENRAAQLPELPVQYIDYAAWERSAVQGAYEGALLDYWRDALAGMPQVLDFPTDFPRPAQQTYVGKTHFFTIPKQLSAQLHQFSQDEQVTLYMTLLSAMQAMVYRYTGQADFGIGSAFAGIGRSFSEMESLIGCFINMLVLRSRFTDEMSYRQLLAQTKEYVLAAGRHQALPFEKLVEALQPRRMSVNPFFQMAFIFEGGQLGTLQYPELAVSPQPSATETSKYDLSFYLSEVDGALQVGMEYNTDLFLPETIERMAGHYMTLLEGIVANPDALITRLPMLTEAEQVQLLQTWNEATMTSYPDSQCIHHLFQAQVERTPDAIAVVSGGQSLTYAELNQRANQLAHYLQQDNVQPNQFIGLCVARNLDMLVGLLGIHKAGAAYLPMDPDYPAERLAYMLEDTHANLILTQQHLKAQLPETDARVICLDTDWTKITQEDTTNPTSDVQPQNLAYVIHTSGSTGKPKGVQIPHQAVVNFLWTMKEAPGLTSDDVLIAVTTLSFDIAVLELFLPIVVGAKVVIVERDVAMDARLLAEAIDVHQATVMQATPATWNMLVSGGWQGDKNLKILSGGEAISRQLSNDLLDRVGELWNMYGPTETTIWSTIWPIPQGGESILIGKPIANTDIYILDKNLQPVPIGVPGELHIGGDGVSHGYLNRDELTVERFIPNPFKANAKIYKTGDLARYRADGNIECLGRLDFQVKVRGFRIELGEIETVLLEHEKIERAVVTAREDGSGGKRLVAYLIAGENGEVATPELRAFLGETLPPYMIPSQIVWVDEYPLTPNGKVDRRALPEPDFEQLDMSASYVAPRTKLETTLALIWADVLNLERVGVHDNFFELGGHSLLAVRMMSLIQKQTGHKLTLGVLFQAPTIAELAVYLDDDLSEKEVWQCLVEIQQGDKSRPPLFCVHGAGGNVMNFHDLAQYLDDDQPFYGIQAVGVDGEAAPLQSIEEMAEIYLSEVRKRSPHGTYYLAGFSGGGVVAYEMAQRLRAEGEEVGAVIFFDTFHPDIRAREITNEERQAKFKEYGMAYVWDRAKAKFSRHYEWYKHEWSIRYYVKRNRPLPYELRNWYLTSSFADAVQQYKPKSYDGRVIMFRAMEVAEVYSHGGLDWGWHTVVSDMEIVKMSGTHDSLILDPNVETAVRYLNQIFQEKSVA